jgi:glycosidase
VVPANNAKVKFRWDSNTRIGSASSGHALDNNVEYDGLAHDSRNSLYRVPFGAVNPGTQVTLRFRTYHNDVSGVTIRLYDTAFSKETKAPMARVASKVDCYDARLTTGGNTCDFWQYSYTPQGLGTVYYRFIIADGTATAYYVDNDPRYGGVGKATSDSTNDNGFRLNVVDSKFKVIPWMENGVMYQIFPDRFRNGNPKNDPKPTDPRYDYPAPPNATPQQVLAANNAQILNKIWSDLPEGYCRAYVKPAAPCAEDARGRDYFGGDLQGLQEKLDYLGNLGITIIYLNPIFESGSNHGYDTRDYLQISQYFGTNQEFKKLVKAADDRGIRIILDGVFNHLSSDSPFFDRYHHYTTVGACESPQSPYRAWFSFTPVAQGTGQCANDQGQPNSATYVGWAGFDSIPVIQKQSLTDPTQPNPPVAQYFYRDKFQSVANYWLWSGISGWRFDVMTDPSFPAAYWQQLREITKGIKPDETLIAEGWHWYDNLPLTHGDQADTAMGYRFRNAVLGLLGAVDNKDFPEETNPNLPPSTFAKRMDSMREDYADATYYTFQNLLDSHDTKRVLWSLTPGQDNRQDKEFNLANLATGKARLDIAALVQMTTPGTPTIYYGDEVGVTGADDPDDRRVFPWQDLLNQSSGDNTGAAGPANFFKNNKYSGAGGDHALFDWYQKLIDIRKGQPVLRQGNLTFLLTDDTNQILAYAMRQDNQLALIVINLNEAAAQAINVPTAGYLRNGVNFKDFLNGGNAATVNGQLSLTLQPLKAAIFVMKDGQDIKGPAAPKNLTARVVNGVTSTVNLSWQGRGDPTGFNIYRSIVQGGGYLTIGTVNTTTYADTSAANGTTYYYVVRGVDALGNEGEASNEASASPAFPINEAFIQYPPTITKTINATPDTVYGQIFIDGLTNAGGDPDSVLAQVGFGAPATDPAAWNWQPMTYNAGHTGDQYYEYQGQIRADAPGTYNYLVRFSNDGGQHFTYGYVRGTANQPGIMTVTPSSDTTAPGTPTASIDFAASSLTVSWTAVTDPDDAVAEYRIYRGDSPGGESSSPLAIVSGSTLSYVDSSVSSGQTYYYKVKAFDTSLNASAFSNEVAHKVEPKLVQVTFRVKVPAFTPPSDTVYITGQSQGVSPDPLCGYCGGTASTAMTETAPGSHIWQITLGIPDGTPIQYKYTRGTYDYVEEWGSITGVTNRVASVKANSLADTTQLFDDTSDSNPDDNHKAVQNWRDTLVTGTSATASAITVTFNWDVKSDGSDFSSAIGVTKGGSPVAGSVSHDAGAKSLTFTPNAPLTSGAYSVTVDHVVALTVQGDGIKIRQPYIFSFNIP